MKSFLITVGKAAESFLPIFMTAVSSGMTKSVPEIFVHYISETSDSTPASGLAADIDSIAKLFDKHEAHPFCRTVFRFTSSHPRLPDRDAMTPESMSGKLMNTLRGDGVPLSLHSDREAVEWSADWLFRTKGPEQFFPASFMGTLSAAASDTSKPLPRLLILCDPGDAFSSGITFALLRSLNSVFRTRRPFTCLIMASDTSNTEQSQMITKQTLHGLSSGNLVRLSTDDFATPAADAAWLVACPSGLAGPGGSRIYTDFAVSRIIAEFFALNVFPEPGLHVHRTPLVLTAHSLGDEYSGAAQFFKFAVWMLTSLLERIRDSISHDNRRHSISGIFRSRPFRTLFQSQSDTLSYIVPLERLLTAYVSQCLLLFRNIPELMRSSNFTEALWKRAVHCCGQYITNAAEYSVSYKEAEESGVTFNMPVHRWSLADTDEEIIIQKLDKMKTTVASALHERDTCFSEAGHTIASLALMDCLDKCRSALSSSRARLTELPRTSEAADKLNIRLQERRVKYLEEAVRITLDDLHTISDYEKLKSLTPSHSPAASGFVNQIVSEKALEALQNLLSINDRDSGNSDVSDDDRESAVRSLTAMLPELFNGSISADEKALMRALSTSCRDIDTDRPLTFFLVSAYSACDPGHAPSMPLDQTASGIDSLEFMMLPDIGFSDEQPALHNISDRLIFPESASNIGEIRGLTALLILSQYREIMPRDTSLEFEPVSRDASVFVSACLDAYQSQEAQIVLLHRDDKRLPLCLLLPGRLPVPSFWSDEHNSMLPGFVIWRDPDTGRLTDPSLLLGETDRNIISCQLTAIRAAMDGKTKNRLDAFLQNWHRDLARTSRSLKEETDPRLSVRLSGVCGLYRLGSYGELSRIECKYRDNIKDDHVSAYIAGSESLRPCQADMRSDIIYTWRDVPFARESSATLLESVHAAEEGPVLKGLEDECRLLFRSSDNYRDTLIAGINELLDKYPKATARSLSAALNIQKSASEPISESVTTLTVPFDENSAALKSIISECLGDRLAKAALHPFSDLLIVFPAKAGQLIGDSLLSGACVINTDQAATATDPSTFPPEQTENGNISEYDKGDTDAHADTTLNDDAVLPPLSPELASSLTVLPEGTRLLEQGFLRFERRPYCIRAELLLNGAFPLKLVRDYHDQEIIYLYSDDIPTAAVWPAIPFEQDRWKTYYAYAHSSDFFRLSAVCASGKENPLDLSPDGRSCVKMPQYPVCIIFRHDDKTAGALPNILPVPSHNISDTVTVCIDTGTYGTSVVLHTPDGPRALTGSNMLRLLIGHPVNATELLRREFITELPQSSFFPNALNLHSGDAIPPVFPVNATVPYPIILKDLASQKTITGISPAGSDKDTFKEYIHEVMLQAALQVRLSGASCAAWKFAFPEQNTPDRRREAAACLENIADTVINETGLTQPEKGPLVSYAAQSAALGAYFRHFAPSETAGGFIALDAGHSFTSFNVFLRGQDSVVWSERHPLTLHDTLLPFLINTPELLRQDYAFTGNESLLSDIRLFEELLNHASDNPASMRRACHAAGIFIAENSAVIAEAAFSRAQGGSPAITFSIMLAHFCWTALLAGVLISAAASSASGAREFPNIVPLCISGMGSKMIETLPAPWQGSVFSFLNLFQTSGSSDVRPIFSSDRKLEIPIGLGMIQTGTPERIVDRGGTVPLPASPDTILSGFLRMFRTVFPRESELLFSGFFAQDIYNSFTPYAQDMIAAAVGKAFADAVSHTGYACLSACLNDLFRLMIERSHDSIPGGHEWNA